MVNKKIILGKVIILIIVLLLIVPFSGLILTTKIGQSVRTFSFHISRRVAQLYLNYRTRDYHALEGQGFIVKYSAADEDIAQQTIQLTEKYLQEIQETLKITLPQKRRFLLVIYPDKESLNTSFGCDRYQNPMGVYWAGSISILSPYAWPMSDLETESLQELFQKKNPLAHELTHLIVDYLSNGNYPRWLSEGLAQYTEMKLTNYTLPRPEEDLGLVALEQLDNRLDDPQLQLQAYWQAREMVQYLVREYGWEKIVQYLLLLGEKPSEEAFSAVYDFSPVDLFCVVFDN